MKFKTQHKSFMIEDERGKTAPYIAHRNKNTVWATRKTEKNNSVAVFTRTFEFVSQAKNWMNRPTVY